jgi:hypothetical protein
MLMAMSRSSWCLKGEESRILTVPAAGVKARSTLHRAAALDDDGGAI